MGFPSTTESLGSSTGRAGIVIAAPHSFETRSVDPLHPAAHSKSITSATAVRFIESLILVSPIGVRPPFLHSAIRLVTWDRYALADARGCAQALPRAPLLSASAQAITY